MKTIYRLLMILLIAGLTSLSATAASPVLVNEDQGANANVTVHQLSSLSFQCNHYEGVVQPGNYMVNSIDVNEALSDQGANANVTVHQLSESVNFCSAAA